MNVVNIDGLADKSHAITMMLITWNQGAITPTGMDTLLDS